MLHAWQACAANERATVAAVLEQHGGHGDGLAAFPALRDKLQKAVERVLMTAAERNDATVFDRAHQEAAALELPAQVTAAGY